MLCLKRIVEKMDKVEEGDEVLILAEQNKVNLL